MTIKEALIAELSPLTIDEYKVDKALQDQELQPTDVYVKVDHEKGVDLSYAGLLMKMIGISEEREDDLSNKFTTNYAAIVSGIYKKWGLVDPYLVTIPVPRVRQVIIW